MRGVGVSGDARGRLRPSTERATIRSVNPRTVDLALEDLRVGVSPRESGVDPRHVRVLTEVAGRWPPIVVTLGDHRVVDGHHRIAAARILGHSRITAVLFDGTPEEAYVESVRRNTEHGLPLTLSERRLAAAHILRLCAQWSDRRIAIMCALSPRTIAAMRRTVTTLDRPAGPLEQRIGTDGRLRPADPAASRRRIAEALLAQPDASLRMIAQQLGTSPETVRSVRQRLSNPDPTPCVDVVDGSATQSCEPGWWRSDAALASTDDGRQLAKWLTVTDVEASASAETLRSVPLSRVYALSSEARRRAAFWTRFAEVLDARAGSRT
jgi:hypothetical protein